MPAMLLTLAHSDADWFPFTPQNDVGPSVIGMGAWANGPLKKESAIRIKDDRLVLANGQPIKLCGVKNANVNATPSHSAAELCTARFAKLGINTRRCSAANLPSLRTRSKLLAAASERAAAISPRMA